MIEWLKGLLGVTALEERLAGMGEDLITLFDGQVRAMFGEEDLTDRFDLIGGFYKKGVLTLWALGKDDFIPEEQAGEFWLRVDEVLPITHGGIGPMMKGAALWRGGADYVGMAEWLPAARGVRVQIVKGQKVRPLSANQPGRSNDWPESFHYGFAVWLTIAVP